MPISSSPFCAKLELYVRLTERDYEIVNTDNRKSPTKQLPYAIMDDGEVIAGSDHIVARLEKSGPSLDEGLAGDAKAAATELEKKAEVVMYFGTLYTRWTDDAGWKACKGMVVEMLPPVIGSLFAPLIRKPVIKRAARHGFATRDDLSKAVAVVGELSEALGDKPYLTGDAVRVADCCVWGQLAIAASTPTDNPLTEAIKSKPNLIEFVNRVADQAKFQMSV